MLVHKAAEEKHLGHYQVKDSSEGVLRLLFGLDEAKEIGEKLSARFFLENANQSKFGSATKALASQKSLEDDQFPRTSAKAHGFLNNH